MLTRSTLLHSLNASSRTSRRTKGRYRARSGHCAPPLRGTMQTTLRPLQSIRHGYREGGSEAGRPLARVGVETTHRPYGRGARRRFKRRAVRGEASVRWSSPRMWTVRKNEATPRQSSQDGATLASVVSTLANAVVLLTVVAFSLFGQVLLMSRNAGDCETAFERAQARAPVRECLPPSCIIDYRPGKPIRWPAAFRSRTIGESSQQ